MQDAKFDEQEAREGIIYKGEYKAVGVEQG